MKFDLIFWWYKGRTLLFVSDSAVHCFNSVFQIYFVLLLIFYWFTVIRGFMSSYVLYILKKLNLCFCETILMNILMFFTLTSFYLFDSLVFQMNNEWCLYLWSYFWEDCFFFVGVQVRSGEWAEPPSVWLTSEPLGC